MFSDIDDINALNKAYKEARVRTHPDKPTGSHDAFIKVTNAYEKRFDELKHKMTSSSPGFGSFFESLRQSVTDYDGPEKEQLAETVIKGLVKSKSMTKDDAKKFAGEVAIQGLDILLKSIKNTRKK